MNSEGYISVKQKSLKKKKKKRQQQQQQKQHTASLLPTQSKDSAYLKHGPEVCTEPVVDGVPAFVHRQKVADAVTDAVPGDGILDGGQRRQVGPLVFQELDLMLIVAS